jgi:hypothetical protein
MQEICDEDYLVLKNLKKSLDELDKGDLLTVLELWDVSPCLLPGQVSLVL